MKIFKIKVTPFPGWVNVWYGEPYEINEYFKKKGHDIKLFDAGTIGKVMKIDTDTGSGVAMFLTYDVEDLHLWHECLHAAWYTLEEFGVDINIDNHEALAYMQGHFFEEIKKRLK